MFFEDGSGMRNLGGRVLWKNGRPPMLYPITSAAIFRDEPQIFPKLHHIGMNIVRQFVMGYYLVKTARIFWRLTVLYLFIYFWQAYGYVL